jgi:hypothetical protein
MSKKRCPWNHNTSFIHSFSILSYDRYIASSKTRQSASKVSSFNFQYPLHSLRPSSCCLLLLPRLPVASILPYLFYSVTCFRRQLLRKMRPVQLVFLLFVCRTFLSSWTKCNTFSFFTRLAQLIFSILHQLHISKLSKYFWSVFQSGHISAPYKAMLQMYEP